jgi:phenylalanyl-tRNA synthetase beta chain
MRPINAIVDITNYVMLATGQPTHAFDSDNIKGHITVRRARDAEKLLLLNDKQLSLTTEDLAITDDEGPVALAGVMGGVKDSVLPETSNVILEIANFEAMGVRRTSTRFDVRTEAAARYEKNIDPERCDIALILAMQLYAGIFPDMSVTGFRDVYPTHLKRNEIDVSLDWLEKRLGKRIPNESIALKLEKLGFDVGFNGDMMHITAPTWRSTGDVSIPNDIIEEVARIHGFENFEPAPIAMVFDGAINQPNIDIDRKLREYLAFR